MKHSDYWRGRFEALNESLLRQGIDCYDDIEREYRQAMQRIEKDITVWYQRLAANNDISFAAAKKLLSANELEELRWSVEEYIKKGKENAVNQRWIKQLENASAKVHISRLEAIKLQMQQHLEVLYGNQLDSMDKAMRKLYQTGYYRTAYEVQRGIGVGFDFASIDETRLQKILAKPWAADGKTFSDRIWQSKAQLVNALHTELTQATIRGDPPEQAVRAIAKKMNTSLSNAGRLVMTESAFFASASQKDCFDELGVERYEIIATLDLKTSPICREMDGKVFKQSDYKPGVTAPPLHCWCRSCTAPYFEDNPGVRAARGEDGKTHHVPADMHYEDWYKVYVDKTVKPDEWRKSRENATIKEKWAECVQRIRDDKRGAYTEADIKSAGALLQSELAAQRADKKALYDEARKAYDAFGWEKLCAEQDQLSRVNRGLINPQELGYASKEAAYARYKELAAQMTDLANNQEMQEAYRKTRQAWQVYQGSQQDNMRQIKAKLAGAREMGCGKSDMDSHLNHSRSSMKKIVCEAYDYYPSDWVKRSISRGNLTPKKVNRGYYNDYEIAISGDGEQALSTAFHELGHRFERAVPGILDAEKAFYQRRTAGETLQWLGGGYARHETTRKDKFLSPYMGKDYGGRAYELVSMGFQLAYVNPVKLWEDEDMAQWIYGILSLM